jgi:hypothetical protein
MFLTRLAAAVTEPIETGRAQKMMAQVSEVLGLMVASVATAALIALLLFALTLTITSLVSTGKIDPDSYQSGTLVFSKDFFWYNAALLVFLTAACRALRVARVSDRAIRRLTGWLLVLTAIAGLLWILLAKAKPAGEQKYLFDAAMAIISGKTKDLVRESGSLFFYFAPTPNQFGNLAYVELLTACSAQEASSSRHLR